MEVLFYEQIRMTDFGLENILKLHTVIGIV